MNFFETEHCKAATECRHCRSLVLGRPWRKVVCHLFNPPKEEDFECPNGKSWVQENEEVSSPPMDDVFNPPALIPGPIHIVVSDDIRALSTLSDLQVMIEQLPEASRTEGLQLLEKNRKVIASAKCGSCAKPRALAEIRVWLTKKQEVQHATTTRP